MLIQVMQVVLSIILLIRIGGILLRKINVNIGIGNIYIFVIGIVLSGFNIRSIFTSILFILTVINFIINEVYRRTLYKKYKLSCLDFIESISIVLLIAVYIYCSM